MNKLKACCNMSIDGSDRDRLLNLFKALSHPVRFAIVEYLVNHPGCITGDIVSILPVAQATTSQHLKVLREAGIIQGDIEGTAVRYCLNEETLLWLSSTVGDIF